jgi:hypothetical protein
MTSGEESFRAMRIASASRLNSSTLEFDPRLPLAREIAAYQKLRIKRLRHAQR